MNRCHGRYCGDELGVNAVTGVDVYCGLPQPPPGMSDRPTMTSVCSGP